MANIKVKFRKSTVVGKAGTVYYQICHASASMQVSTTIHVQPEQWDAENERVRSVGGDARLARMYNLKITSDLNTLSRIASELGSDRRRYTAADMVARFRSSASKITVLEYMRRQIEQLMRKKKYGTAANYQCALNSFSAFLGDSDVSFSVMNEGIVLKYSDWLEERDMKRNSISFYMRIWRAVYNRAVREYHIPQTHPFDDVYTGIEHTRKRAVGEDIIMKLVKLDLSDSPSLDLSRDLFVFSYCTRGMAFVDIAFLTRQNIINGTLVYRRRKTSQLMTIKIEPCIGHIIEKYQNDDRGTGYLFPILTQTGEKEAYRQYHIELNYHNRKLKQLADMIGADVPLSSYTSRHSWATTARNHNIPLSIISAGMGHASEKTTEIYLASLQNSVIDDANENVLSEINLYTSC